MTRVITTQAQWDAERRAAKAAAAEAIVANREDAIARLLDERGEAKAAELAGLKAVRDAQAQDEVESVEDETTASPYAEWTKDQLSDELQERGLPHSGNKDELIARLDESDADPNNE